MLRSYILKILLLKMSYQVACSLLNGCVGYLNNSKPEQVTFPDTPYVDNKRLQGSLRECYVGLRHQMRMLVCV